MKTLLGFAFIQAIFYLSSGDWQHPHYSYRCLENKGAELFGVHLGSSIEIEGGNSSDPECNSITQKDVIGSFIIKYNCMNPIHKGHNATVIVRDKMFDHPSSRQKRSGKISSTSIASTSQTPLLSHVQPSQTSDLSHLQPSQTLHLSHLQPSQTLHMSHLQPSQTLHLSHLQPSHTPDPSHLQPSQPPDPSHLQPSQTLHLSHLQPSQTPDSSHLQPSQTQHLSHLQPSQTLHPSHLQPSQIPDPSHLQPSQIPDPSHLQPSQIPDPSHLQPSQTPHSSHLQPSQIPDPSHLQPSQTLHLSHLQPSQTPDSSHLQPSQTQHLSHLQPSQTLHPSLLPPSQPPDPSHLQPSQIPDTLHLQPSQIPDPSHLQQSQTPDLSNPTSVTSGHKSYSVNATGAATTKPAYVGGQGLHRIVITCLDIPIEGINKSVAHVFQEKVYNELPNNYKEVDSVEMRFKAVDNLAAPDISTVYIGDEFYMFIKYMGVQNYTVIPEECTAFGETWISKERKKVDDNWVELWNIHNYQEDPSTCAKYPNLLKGFGRYNETLIYAKMYGFRFTNKYYVTITCQVRIFNNIIVNNKEDLCMDIPANQKAERRKRNIENVPFQTKALTKRLRVFDNKDVYLAENNGQKIKWGTSLWMMIFARVTLHTWLADP